MSEPRSFARESRQRTLAMAWIPVVLGLVVICLESTQKMSAATTGGWLMLIFRSLWEKVDENFVGTLNFVLRKLGHFCGYGTLALLFRRAWIMTFRLTWEGPRIRLMFSASALAVVFTLFVACMD